MKVMEVKQISWCSCRIKASTFLGSCCPPHPPDSPASLVCSIHLSSYTSVHHMLPCTDVHVLLSHSSRQEVLTPTFEPSSQTNSSSSTSCFLLLSVAMVTLASAPAFGNGAGPVRPAIKTGSGSAAGPVPGFLGPIRERRHPSPRRRRLMQRRSGTEAPVTETKRVQFHWDRLQEAPVSGSGSDVPPLPRPPEVGAICD